MLISSDYCLPRHREGNVNLHEPGEKGFQLSMIFRPWHLEISMRLSPSRPRGAETTAAGKLAQ